MVFCTNCHCDIEESKMVLHQRFCIQNIKYCEQCQEGIIIEEYEEHCKEHNTKEKSKSKELRDSLTLKRVQSSKIGCEFCGFICSFDELVEHETMCGSRSTSCKQCCKTILIKDLKNHIKKEHNLELENYQALPSNSSLDFNKQKTGPSDSSLFGNLDLKRMTTDEEIAYALALSAEEEQKKKKEKKDDNNKTDNKLQKKISLEKQKSEKVDFEELEYEYEKQLYEEEMKNYDKED